MQAMALTGQLRNDPGVQVVAPARVIYELFDGLVGPLRTLLLALTGLIVVVAAIGVMVSIYNTMAQRQREIAVMRALGAERTTVMSVVLLESVLLALAGAVGGLVLGHLLVAALAPALEARTGVIIGLTSFRYEELYILPAVLALSAVAGIVPGLAAYRTDVAKSLSAGM
jgi:putative ABC transport system permease protein